MRLVMAWGAGLLVWFAGFLVGLGLIGDSGSLEAIGAQVRLVYLPAAGTAAGWLIADLSSRDGRRSNAASACFG